MSRSSTDAYNDIKTLETFSVIHDNQSLTDKKPNE